MFRGRYEHAIDAKGRTSVPSRFREVMTAQGDSQLVLTTGLESCLVAYPMAEWLAFENRLSALPQFDSNVVTLKRIYVSGAVECDVDKVGRLLIPAALRKHAGLKRDALWAGMGSYIELWAKEGFEDLRKEVLSDQDRRLEIARRLAELGL
ncbi:MAG: division/cell wall cluster transcriptional repressor MraZ [Deltaproteobacteria bacterium]|nr:division/cell wall cluster transcriptional repressor MraZ [Deltaproteobacteria bacterium]NND28656.1 division/cell wall cluster transcriptional repressor MraZ [Myxococcales bacterium]MBT8466504.1 division/cell wall cluster transcriptional repressor MraZ [Deltaproteobacteria bacterium]MBT8481878.1 division/cell wall cluster transcriptional repressor MraZ [Deltaproteobacteria bacterium]NNK08092.1 division/cell wall cluster transcriptional repressor MraZ [Myxococcales bacterium]